jgi:hypothetical protein
MIRSLALPVTLALSALLGGCVDEERVVYVRSVPPPEAAEVVAATPGPGYYYVRGHWEWNGARYVWKPSRYIRRPHARAAWVEGHWQSSPQGWYWEPGHWTTAGKAPHVYTVPTAPPAAPPVIVEEQAPPPANGEEEEFVSPPQSPTATPKGVPQAPTYLPPPPPATRPLPPSPTAPAPVPQRYVAPTPGSEY